MARIVIFGIGKTADVAYAQFKHGSDHHIVGFAVDREYLPAEPTRDGLPVVAWDEAATAFPPSDHLAFVAIGYHELNAHRAAAIARVRATGYSLASYVAPGVGPVEHGEHCFVMDGAVVQPMVRLGSDVWVWSGAIVAHHTRIDDHCWIASGACIGGGATIGTNCFLGMGAVVGHELTIGKRSFLGAGSLVLQNAPDESVFITPGTERFRLNATQFLRMTRMR